ncbi:MAG: DNA topoisomerase, partial [Chloroflexota bacterium]
GKENPPPPLPPLTRGEEVNLLQVLPEQHFTQPPPRYTEATLIKALEEKGIGRPSTYAPTLSALKFRGYVEIRQGRLYPEKIGLVVNDFLSEHFPDIMNLDFTAQVESQLDSIAQGEIGANDMLGEFYTPFKKDLERVSLTQPKLKIEDEPSGENCPTCGQPMVIKRGRFGKFLGCSALPQCKTTRPFLVKIGLPCPLCGGDIVERHKRGGGLFYGCSNYPQCHFSSRYKPTPQSSSPALPAAA